MTRRELFTTIPALLLHRNTDRRPLICMFSKHLQQYDYDRVGKLCKELGFDGVDLTVRPGGHVLPENVERDLPTAVAAIRNHGLSVPMITTGLTSPDDPALVPTFSTAARLKIPLYKPGYWRYRTGVLATLQTVKQQLRKMVDIASHYGLVAGFHNHSGDYVGMAVWDIHEIIRDMDPRWIGYYFDPCHAVAEGGRFGWKAALDLASERLKIVAVKDFYWARTQKGWQMQMCPLGEGMVDWDYFFDRLARIGFTGPISLHLEYEPNDELAAIAKDVDFLHRQVQRAYKL